MTEMTPTQRIRTLRAELARLESLAEHMFSLLPVAYTVTQLSRAQNLDAIREFHGRAKVVMGRIDELLKEGS